MQTVLFDMSNVTEVRASYLAASVSSLVYLMNKYIEERTGENGDVSREHSYLKGIANAAQNAKREAETLSDTIEDNLTDDHIGEILGTMKEKGFLHGELLDLLGGKTDDGDE